MKNYKPNFNHTWVDSLFVPPEGFSSGRWFQMMWPWILVAIFAGITFELAKIVIFKFRRNIYNRHRNLKYADKEQAETRRTQKEQARKNQRWRTKVRNANTSPILPLPPHFTEDLCKQWDKVHDSLDEMLKLGKMLIELEDYVDNSFKYNINGDIIGRKPGMKGFLSMHCPFINYKTAMRYRMFALKAREIKDKAKLTEIRTKSETIGELWKNFDLTLVVDYRHLKYRHRKKHRCRDNAVFALRDQAHSATQHRSRTQKERYAAAMQDLVRELSVS